MEQGLCNGRVSVCPSIPSLAAAFDRYLQWRGGQEIYRLLQRATALSSICGQCHVDSWRRKLNKDLLGVAASRPRLARFNHTGYLCYFHFFGHMTRADPKHDHHRVIGASLRPPSHWRRPCGRPRTSWLRATDADVQSVNIGIHSAWRKASDSGDASSTRQHSIMRHATTEERGCLCTLRSFANCTGWAKKTGPQIHDHNSVKSWLTCKIFSLEDSPVNLQLNAY